MKKLNFVRLVNDCGGASKLAKSIGRTRTLPYAWMKNRKCSTKVLEEIKTKYPTHILDNYFEEVEDEGEQKA